jgi:predicted DNA-binding protein with PD1-like motif
MDYEQHTARFKPGDDIETQVIAVINASDITTTIMCLHWPDEACEHDEADTSP